MPQMFPTLWVFIYFMTLSMLMISICSWFTFYPLLGNIYHKPEVVASVNMPELSSFMYNMKF